MKHLDSISLRLISKPYVYYTDDSISVFAVDDDGNKYRVTYFPRDVMEDWIPLKYSCDWSAPTGLLNNDEERVDIDPKNIIIKNYSEEFWKLDSISLRLISKPELTNEDFLKYFRMPHHCVSVYAVDDDGNKYRVSYRTCKTYSHGVTPLEFSCDWSAPYGIFDSDEDRIEIDPQNIVIKNCSEEFWKNI